jgi:thiamine biosynthesis lipoprotein
MGSLNSFRYTFHAMAAEHELQLFAASARLAQCAADAAIADVARIEAKYSRYRDDSVTTRINRAAGRERVTIDAETVALLRYADQCFRLSEGAFDVTSGVLRRVWDFRAQPARVPAADAIAAARACIGWSDVEWDDRGVRLPREGMEIDFGGIGKEYAADRVATICLEHGIAHALVNLGGDVRVIGGQPDGSPWCVGIRDPRVPDRAAALLEVDDGAVATSGDYERYFDLDGRRYCHILDPRSGMPVTHWQSISVVAPLCIVAGSCATIAMLFEERALAFLAAQRYDYLAIDAAGQLHRAGAHFPIARHPS